MKRAPICTVYGPYSTGWKHHEKKRAAGRVFRLAGKALLCCGLAVVGWNMPGWLGWW